MPTVSGHDLWQWRSQAHQQAIAAAVSTAEVDWFLQELAGLDRLSLRLESFKAQPAIALSLPLYDLEQLWQRRLRDRVPVQYLAGITPWRQFSLRVSPAVLIPRPETELIIDLAIAASQSSTLPTDRLQPVHWADLGTGSGAIALGLADAFPDAIIHAVDTSAEALAIAQHNARQYQLHNRIQFHQGSWFQPLSPWKGKLSGMVSNPPYIPSSMVPDLQPEVTDHEPHLALDGGLDGLDCIRHLVESAPDYLQPGGVWLIEMMAGQADAVEALLRTHPQYHQIQIHADLAGIARFAVAYRR